MTQGKRKYNNQTGCYKIDIFVDGSYWKSSDQYKSCKEAITKTIERFPDLVRNSKVTACFDRS